MQVSPNLFLSIFSRIEVSKTSTSSSYLFLAYDSHLININNSIIPSISTSTNSQSKAITPEKTRRSECLCPDTNVVASKEKSIQHLKDPLANKKMVKLILYNKEKSTQSKNTELVF